VAGPTHKLFIDDSGNKDYHPDGIYNQQGGRTPYFVFGGILITPDAAGRIEEKMRRLKVATFGTTEVEIKARWLRRSDERRRRYLDKYGINENQLAAFTDLTYQAIVEANCMLLACVVDKAEVQQLYKDKAYYAPAIAYECLMQRVQQEMRDCNGHVHVTIDNMTGATPAGNQHAYLLRRQHSRMREYGSRLMSGMAFDRVGGMAFRDSHLDERLQLADLVAYAVYRQFVDHGSDWEDSSKPLPVYDYLARLVPKFRNNNRRIQGYGIVKFPMNRRVRWVAKVE
jgi:hypothetical protein